MLTELVIITHKHHCLLLSLIVRLWLLLLFTGNYYLGCEAATNATSSEFGLAGDPVPGCAQLSTYVDNPELPDERKPRCFCDRSNSSSVVTVQCINHAEFADLKFNLGLAKDAGVDKIDQVLLSSLIFSGPFSSELFPAGMEIHELILQDCKNYPVEFDSKVFQSIRNLTSLVLDNCPANSNSLPLALRNISTLQFLTVTRGDVHQLDRNSFQGLSSLKKLELSQNPVLSELPLGVFDHSPSIEILTVDRSNFNESAFVEINKLSKLTYLSMLFNHINYFNKSLSNLKFLQELYLVHNWIATIPSEAFAGMTSLTKLDLRINLINVTEPNAFVGLSNLRTLLLDGNFINFIPPSAFKGLDSLQSLKLTENEFEIFQDGQFALLSNLELLDVRENGRLSDFSAQTFEGLTKLSELLIGNTRVTSLNDSILSPLTNLMTLDASGSNLRDIDNNTFNSVTNLKALLLNSTSIRSLPEQALNTLKSNGIEYLDLTGNSYVCDDQLRWMPTWINESWSVLAHPILITCGWPEELSDHSIMFITDAEHQMPHDNRTAFNDSNSDDGLMLPGPGERWTDPITNFTTTTVAALPALLNNNQSSSSNDSESENSTATTQRYVTLGEILLTPRSNTSTRVPLTLAATTLTPPRHYAATNAPAHRKQRNNQETTAVIIVSVVIALIVMTALAIIAVITIRARNRHRVEAFEKSVASEMQIGKLDMSKMPDAKITTATTTVDTNNSISRKEK